MARPIPKLAQRQGIRQQTPPPLVQWDLNELEQSRWEALTSHSKIFAPASQFSKPSNPSPKFSQHPTPKTTRTQSKGPETQTIRPPLMPNLDIQHSAIQLSGKSLLEQAEIVAASEAIDQTSLRFQVKVRRNVELIHEEDLKIKENQWKDKIAKKREELEAIRKREIELREVVKKYAGKKGLESEASKELARVIEVKAKISDDVNACRIKRMVMEKTINELHVDLEKNSLSYESKEKNIIQELEKLKRQVDMSENEKLDTVAYTKESLTKKKSDLLLQRQGLIDKWQVENKDFKDIFEKTEEKRTEIRTQLRVLKNEKEFLHAEKKVLEGKIREFEEEKSVNENNKKTLSLYRSFEDPKGLKGLKEFEGIVKESLRRIMQKGEEEEVEEGGKDIGEFLRVIRRNLSRRKGEIVKNTQTQVKLIDEQMEVLKRANSEKKISLLKGMLRK